MLVRCFEIYIHSDECLPNAVYYSDVFRFLKDNDDCIILLNLQFSRMRENPKIDNPYTNSR